MGFLQTSNDLVNNVNKATSKILDSKFTQFITGNGVPVLVDYYNLNETMSTANSGTENLDMKLGEDSPLRYNHIKNFPIYGLKDLLPSKDEIDMGLIDLTLDAELIILPNTIKPHEYDYFIYKLPYIDKELVFRVEDFELTTIKSNSYYKITTSVRDYKEDEIKKRLDRQTVTNKTAIIDNIGSQEKCIIDDDIVQEIDTLKKVNQYIMEQYIDTFWNKKYNSFLYKEDGSKYLAYDPYLTEFIRRHNLVDIQDDVYIVLTNYDGRNEARIGYNRSIYHNIELQDITKLRKLVKIPTSFATTSTNPFYYYGEDITFTLDLVENDIGVDDVIYYTESELIDRIINNEPLMIGEPVKSRTSKTTVDSNIKDSYDNMHKPEESDYQYITYTNADDEPNDEESNDIFESITHKESFVFWNLIITYLNRNSCYNLLDDSGISLNDLVSLGVDYNLESYLYIPVLVYIINQYIKYLTNN